jgi:rubredoxin
MTEELKPCPKCRNKELEFTEYFSDGKVMVNCYECKYVFDGEFKSPKEAIKAWNKWVKND